MSSERILLEGSVSCSDVLLENHHSLEMQDVKHVMLCLWDRIIAKHRMEERQSELLIVIALLIMCCIHRYRSKTNKMIAETRTLMQTQLEDIELLSHGWIIKAESHVRETDRSRWLRRSCT